MKTRSLSRMSIAAATGLALAGVAGLASSHREAPMITTMPKLDCADFYMFNSYESGRSNYVTFIANYVPLQDAYGGPNYFTLAPTFEGRYEIHIDNSADAQEDITFQFRFTNTAKDIPLVIGPPGNQKTNAVPVINVGPITAGNTSSLNVDESYQIDLILGDRRTGTISIVSNAVTGAASYRKPVDNIGNKSLPDYDSYAATHLYEIALTGHPNGRVFVGQRKDSFVVNLGETFDLVNIGNPLGAVDAEKDSLFYKNVTSIILELPKSLLVRGTNPVIAAWTTASKITRTNAVAGQSVSKAGGSGSISKLDHNLNVVYSQVSRLGHPLVNEVVIGLKDKDKFNASSPKDDPQFLDYVTHPTLPAILELLFGGAGVKAPTLFPRNDLVSVFLTGVDGLNKDGSVGEILRLNTSIPAAAVDEQKNLGVLAGDVAGFPNGRRPGDDVVDIALRAVMGVLLPVADAPSGQLPFTDGALVNASMFSDRFPYLRSPLGGSPNDQYINVLLQSSVKVEGPYENVPATFDLATRQLRTAQPDANAGFFRMQADGRVSFDGLKVENGTVKLGIK